VFTFPAVKSHPGTVLAIDAGNTRIKWGVHDERKWTATGAIDTASAGQLHESFRGALPAHRAFATNVAGSSVQAAIESACRAASIPVTFIRGEASRLGVTPSYRDPAQLGAAGIPDANLDAEANDETNHTHDFALRSLAATV
jgi:pantothenate kinase type III